MSALFVVDHAIVRYWDGGDQAAAQRRPGDLEVVCADCMLEDLGLPLGHPSVHRLKIEELDDTMKDACQRCGKEDSDIARAMQRLAAKQFRW